ncbi:hypothetical protein OJ628_10795 [Salmonella enterica subsp. enterica]|nr:hypothetical protein OJ628_10795 [Salmonella enterica subsp. enterica]
MNTFKNKTTEIFYVVSLHIYAELFNSKDKTTSNMIMTHVMDHEFVCRLIDLAMRNAEKHLLKKAWKKNAAEKLSEVDFKGVKAGISQNALHRSGRVNMLMCSDVYRPLHGADNRTIKVLFCGETCFAAVRRLD